MEYDCVIARYGEIALKGGNRSLFERRLGRNIKEILDACGIEAAVKRISGRFIVETKDSKAAEAVARVFGVTSASPALKVKTSLDGMKDAALRLFSEAKPSTFRISANRLEKGFEKTSMEANSIIGKYIQDETGCRVSLKSPELDIGVEIANKNTYVYAQRIEGFGGLPVGVSGNVVCLFSGGIDSPVAAWLALKRGCEATLLHFLHEEHNRRPDKINGLKERLRAYSPGIRLVYVPTGDIEREIVMKVPSRLRIVVLRRMFMRMAAMLCGTFKAKAVVTGDNIGQVASQTLDNLNVIDEACGMLVLRPLAGYDKREIVKLAEEIGTYGDSIREYSDCCSFLLPKHPETKASLEEVRRAEECFGWTLLDKAVGRAYE